MSELEIVKRDSVIDVGVDPTFDNSFGDSYFVPFDRSDVEKMSLALGIDIASLTERVKELEGAIDGLTRAVDLIYLANNTSNVTGFETLMKINEVAKRQLLEKE